MHGKLFLLMASLTAALLIACAAAPYPITPTTMKMPAPAPGPTHAPIATPVGYQRVGGPDLGLTFEVPAGWIKEPDGHVYRARAWPVIRMGVERHSPDQADNIEDILPRDAEITVQEPVNLGWGPGTRYTVTVRRTETGGGTATFRQEHLIAIVGGQAVYDIFVSAPVSDEAALRAAAAAYAHLLGTIVLLGG